MSDEVLRQNNINADITPLVLAALGQNKISGLSEVLENIALKMNAFGCILWQIAPISDLTKRPPEGRLFVQAQWFQNKQMRPVHELPLTSVTGKVVLNQELENVPDISNNPRIYTGQTFLKEAGIRTLCSLPIQFSRKPWGAMNIYRKSPEPFNGEEIRLAELLASLIPALYQIIRDEVSYNLILKVNEILHKAERAPYHPISKDVVKKVIQRICNLVADTFQCMETSIFLEDRLEIPKVYSLVATTWPWPRKFPKCTYRRNESKSLTSWVLSHPKKPVKIFDLAKFDRDILAIRKEYPKIRWDDSLEIRAAALEYFKLTDPKKLQALSFMAAPLAMGGSVLGVIRCCTAKKGPYYFDEHELNLLNLVASQLGQYWNTWLRRREVQEENDSWKALVSNVGGLNSFVQYELSKGNVDEGNIYNEALRVTSEVIKGADILDVRLRANDNPNQLYFAKTWGKAWQDGKAKVIQDRKNRRFEINGESAGAFVFRKATVYETSDVKKAEHYDATFRHLTKRMIVAPIKIETNNFSEVYGVLDVRGTGSRPFPKHAKAIAELLGQQLGLYHFLADTIGRLHKAETELKRLVKSQTQTFEDLEHQLRSPINQALARLQLVLRGEFNDEKLELSLLTIRGLCSKARRVTMSIGLYGNLANDKPIKFRVSRLGHDYLLKMLFEAAMDHRYMIDPQRSINFHIAKESFEVLHSNDVFVDLDLLEQAISNMLDNAYKYSFERTVVRIYGGLTAKERFHITIANKGIPIRPNDLWQVTTRGWRSDMAAWTTGEGSGIGLWIVDHIMKVHGGELIIIPTSSAGITEIKLVFPVTKSQ